MATISELKPEIIVFVARHLAIKNMTAEIMGVMLKYEKQDPLMFLNYVNVRAIMSALADMKTKLVAEIRTRVDTIGV